MTGFGLRLVFEALVEGSEYAELLVGVFLLSELCFILMFYVVGFIMLRYVLSLKLGF